MTEHKNMDLLDLSVQVVADAKRLGADGCEAHIINDQGFNVAVRMGDIDSVEYHVEQSLDITVYVGHKTAVASTTDLSNDAIQNTIEKAVSIASFTQDDAFAGLAEPELMAKSIPDLDLYHPWDLQPEQAIEMAKNCEQIGMAVDPRITNSEGCSLSTNSALRCYANSHGFQGSYKTTSHSVNCMLIAQENGNMQRDYDYVYARDHNDLGSIEHMARSAAKQTVDRLGAKKIATMNTPVIFQHELAVGLFANFFRAISGGSIYRKSSFLLDHLDKKVFPDWMQICQRPHLKKGLASRPFDSEGVATVDRDFITDGVLQSYILSSYSARKLNMISTGNAGGIQNVDVSHSNVSFDELLGQMGTGLLVTELIGQGVNAVTGDYSRGAFGYWIENGSVQYPVEGITIAGNLKDMFNNIAAISDDTELRSGIRTGSVLMDNMTVAGG